MARSWAKGSCAADTVPRLSRCCHPVCVRVSRLWAWYIERHILSECGGWTRTQAFWSPENSGVLRCIYTALWEKGLHRRRAIRDECCNRPIYKQRRMDPGPSAGTPSSLAFRPASRAILRPPASCRPYSCLPPCTRAAERPLVPLALTLHLVRQPIKDRRRPQVRPTKLKNGAAETGAASPPCERAPYARQAAPVLNLRRISGTGDHRYGIQGRVV